MRARSGGRRGKEAEMNKFARRLGALFAVLLAAVLGLGTATPAQADTYDHTVTFNGVQEGDTVSTYRLVSYTAEKNGYSFDTSFKEYCVGYTDQLSSSSTDDEAAQWLSGLSAEETRLLLKGYVNAWGDKVDKPNVYQDTPPASSTSNPSIKFQDGGYFLVMPNTTADSEGSKLYNPVSVFVKINGNSSTISVGQQQDKVGDVTVEMKSEDGPKLDKYIVRADGSLRKTRTVSPGESTEFAIRVEFGSYANVGDLQPVLHDSPTNLEVTGGIKVCAANPDGSIGSEIEGAVTEPNVHDYANGQQSMDLALNWNMISPDGSAKTVYVVYTAKVMDDIVSNADNNGRYVGSNSAYLTYRTNAQEGQTSQTTASETSVFTYGLEITKLDSNLNALSGAKFKLVDSTNNVAVKFKKVVDAQGAVSYYVVDAGSSDADVVDEVEASSGANSNVLNIRGLDCSRTYTLEESSAPAGYYKPSGKWSITFESQKTVGDDTEHTGNLKTASITSDDGPTAALIYAQGQDVEGATFAVRIKNATTPSLPTTGGMGTVLFTVAGVALMVVAAAIFFMKRRHN